MAEEGNTGGGVPETVVLILGLLIVLGVISYLRTGYVVPPNAKSGVFIHPPSPLGNGEVYGPQIYIGTSSPPTTNN